MRLRVALGTAGILLLLFGAFRLLTEVPIDMLVVLSMWLVGAVIVHDGLLSPIVIAVGWAIARVVPPRARRYLQFALIVAAMVAVVAIPLIYREDSQAPAESMLLQDYTSNLTILVGIVAAVSLLAYASHVARDFKEPDHLVS